jgi:hypothetical protein
MGSVADHQDWKATALFPTPKATEVLRSMRAGHGSHVLRPQNKAHIIGKKLVFVILRKLATYGFGQIFLTKTRPDRVIGQDLEIL